MTAGICALLLGLLALHQTLVARANGRAAEIYRAAMHEVSDSHTRLGRRLERQRRFIVSITKGLDKLHDTIMQGDRAALLETLRAVNREILSVMEGELHPPGEGDPGPGAV